MNLDRIIQMAVRMFSRKIMNKGINAGIDYAARRGKDSAEMNENEKKQARDGREMAKKAKKSARLIRRISRF